MKNTSDLLALINANIADNTTGAVTPAKVREVESQISDSALNKMDTTSQSVSGPVVFNATVKKGANDVLVGVKEVEVLRAYSTAANQQPTALDTPIQIEFGAAQENTHFTLTAAGLLTCKVAGTYAVRIKLQNGRVGASGISYLFTRIVKGSTQVGVSQCTKLSSPDSLIPTDSRVVVNLLAGDTLAGQLVRDSQGANAGGLFGITSSNGWVMAPSALAVITSIEGVA